MKNLAFTLCLLLFASGCIFSNDKKDDAPGIVGTWSSTQEKWTILFREDGTCNYLGESRYAVKGDSLRIFSKLSLGEEFTLFNYPYKLSGNSLTIFSSYGALYFIRL